MNKRKSRKTTETKAARIRALREQGYKSKEIAAFVGCDVQHVYTMNYLDKIRNLAKTATAEHQRHVANLQNVKTVLEQPIQLVGKEPKLTIPQRLRVLFTGRV